MSISDKIPGINRRVGQNESNLTTNDETINDEFLERTKLVFAADLAVASHGIVSDADPASADPTDTSQPLMVVVNPDDPAQVLVFPGRAVTASGLRLRLGAVQPVSLLSANIPGTQSVIFIEYQNEELDPLPVRNRIGDVASRWDIVADEELVKTLSKANFEAQNVATRNRCIPLALVTIQELEDSTTEAVIDLGRAVIAYNRPWFSAVDVAHRAAVGSGVPTPTNPHGVSLNDEAVSGNVTLYHAAIGRGQILAPAASLASVPGSLCTEIIAHDRFQVDTTGAITGVPGAQFVELLGYPVAMGSCVRINGDEDTGNAITLAMRVVRGKDSDAFPTAGRTAVAYVMPDEPIPVDTAYELRYSCVRALEPPVNFNTDPELTFGTPVADEVIIANGLATNTVDDPVLTTAELGPVARRIYILFDSEDGLIHLPQVLLPFSRLSSADAESFPVTTDLIGPSKVRIWLTEALAGAGMSVELTVTGTDTDGSALAETVTFDSTWADNPVPAEFEVASQAKELVSLFASVTEITIDDQVADGPNSAIVVEAIPSGLQGIPRTNYPVPVAYAHWDGYHVSRLTDAREISIKLGAPGIGPSAAIAEGVLAHHAIWPAGGILLSHVLGDDSEAMYHSDLRLTNKWAPRGFFGTDDPTDTSTNEPAANNTHYTSRALIPTNNARWLMVTLHGLPTSVLVQFRYSKSTTPGTWSSFLDFESSDVVTQDRSPSATTLAFYKFLPDLGDFSPTDTIFKFQVRIQGDWYGMNVWAAAADPHSMTLDFLVQALDVAFAVQHWSPATPDEGKHKTVEIVPQEANTRKLTVRRHEDDSGSNIQMLVEGAGVLTAMTLKANGDMTIVGDFTGAIGNFGELVVDADVSAGGDITGGSVTSTTDVTATEDVFSGSQFRYKDIDQRVYRFIPMSLIAMQMSTGDNILSGIPIYDDGRDLDGTTLQFQGIRTMDGSEFWVDIDALTMGGSLAAVEITAAMINGVPGTFTYTVKLQSAPRTTALDTWTTQATSTQSGVSTPNGTRATVSFPITETTPAISLLGLGNFHRLLIRDDSGAGTNQFIYRIALVYDVGSIEQALHIPLPT